MKELYRLFKVDGYEVLDVKMWFQEKRVDVFLKREEQKPLECLRCNRPLSHSRGKHTMRVQGMPLGTLKTYIHFWRHKGHCANCKKARSERIDFLSEHTPHLTKTFATWVASLCEIAAVSRAAEFMGQDEVTTWRLDFERMRELLSKYKIPPVTKISVDEVYARRKPKYLNESRDKKFFTVISDLNTRKVIWVSESRSKEGLDEFFMLIGAQACSEIEVVAIDQHDAYAASIKEHCKRAVIVWDRFHVMQTFEEVVNDTRKLLHHEFSKSSELAKFTTGKYRYLFLKKAARRSDQEKTHIDTVIRQNHQFAKLELIKERMLSFFDATDEHEARAILEEVGDWIFQSGFMLLMNWFKNIERGWDTLKNYFNYRVTTSLSEGINNVIKTLKRRAYGYRNMDYFKLKIMQVCGYLNSRFCTLENQPLTLF